MAIKEFLAYEADTSIAFVKKAPEMPRLDKVLVLYLGASMTPFGFAR